MSNTTEEKQPEKIQMKDSPPDGQSQYTGMYSSGGVPGCCEHPCACPVLTLGLIGQCCVTVWCCECH